MKWHRTDNLVQFRTKWMTLIGEKWIDDKGAELEYWRVERPNSVIVLPLQGDSLLLPRPVFRPGVSSVTIDFPGGRLKESQGADEAVLNILKRELGIEPAAVLDARSLNGEGWLINSSFSNQKLYAYVAEIDDRFVVPPSMIGQRVNRDEESLVALLGQLECLQCRSILLEWLRQENAGRKL